MYVNKHLPLMTREGLLIPEEGVRISYPVPGGDLRVFTLRESLVGLNVFVHEPHKRPTAETFVRVAVMNEYFSEEELMERYSAYLKPQMTVVYGWTNFAGRLTHQLWHREQSRRKSHLMTDFPLRDL